jgi:hypothetical protein
VERNPIYVQLTRRVHWASKRRLGWLSALIAGVGAMLIIGALYFAARVGWGMEIAVTISMILIGIGLVSPMVALVMSALITGRHAAQEHLIMVQLTNLSAGEIVAGYHGAVRKHLMILSAIAAGLAPPIWMVLFYAAGGWLIIDCLLGQCAFSGISLLGFNFTLFISIGLSMIIAIGLNLSELALNTGIWIGLTQRNNGTLVLGAVISAVALASAVIYGFIILTPLGLCSSFLIIPLIIFGAAPLARSIHRRTVDAVQRIQSHSETL